MVFAKAKSKLSKKLLHNGESEEVLSTVSVAKPMTLVFGEESTSKPKAERLKRAINETYSLLYLLANISGRKITFVNFNYEKSALEQFRKAHSSVFLSGELNRCTA